MPMLELTGMGAFILLIIGTLGLLSSEFIFDWVGAVTLTLASLNVVGLAILAYTSFLTHQ